MKLSWPLPFASEPSLYVHSRWERFCKAGGDFGSTKVASDSFVF